MNTASGVRRPPCGGFRTCALLISLLLALGCGQTSRETKILLHAVQGRVTVAGTPAEGVVVSLHPLSTGAAAELVPSAVSGSDGTFRVGTFRPGDGAPEGEYAVTCVWPKSASADAAEVDQLRGRYSGTKKSKLRAAIRPEANDLPLTLQ